MALTAFFCNLKMDQCMMHMFDPKQSDHIVGRTEKALYKQTETSYGSKFLILKNIPHVLDTFLASSLR